MDEVEPSPTDHDISVPWSTSFEAEFCAYDRAGGFCYADPAASFETVEAPVHTGRHAAAFSIATVTAEDGDQTRCVNQGRLPLEATYGAWFYLPTNVSAAKNWNLIHFQGGVPDNWHGLWDVSIEASAEGMFLYVFDALNDGVLHKASVSLPLPVATWFHVEFFLRRAADATGSVALYQDGQLLLQLDSVVTDDSNAAQWYLGNLANELTPSDYTLYVDDVSVRAH